MEALVKVPDLALFLTEIRGPMTFREAGKRAGIYWTHINDFERGRRTPSRSQLTALAQAYGVDRHGVDRHFVLLYADFLRLPGFESLLGEPDEESALTQLLQAASIEEKRQLIKHLASIRLMPPAP